MTVYSPDFERKVLRRIDGGKGMTVSAEELRFLVRCDAVSKISEDAARIRREVCLERKEQNPSTKGANSNSTPEKAATSKSSGTTNPGAAKEALAQTQRILGRQS